MSSNKKTNELSSPQSKSNEVVINRLLLMFMLSVVGIVVLLYMGKLNVSQTVWLYKSQLPLIMLIITGLLFVGSAVLFIKNKIARAEERKKTINSLNLLSSSAFIFLCALYFKFPGNLSYSTIASRLLVALVVITVLYFIFYLYQREFFILSLLTAPAGVGIFYSGNIIIKAILLVYAAIIFAAVVILYAKKGSIKLKGEKYRIIKGKMYLPFITLSILLLAVSVLLFILPGINIYGLVAVFAYYLILGIYYTVKQI